MRRRPSVGSLARNVSRVYPSLELPRTAHFVLKRRALDAPILTLAVCAFTFVSVVASAGATKTASSGKAAQAAPLSLVSEYSSLNPHDPPWCMSEDDDRSRTWSGSLEGSFTATEYLCNEAVDYYNGIWWSPGGLGVQAEVAVSGSVSGLAIASPLGESHEGVLMGSSTSKGVTTDYYEVCYMPPFSLSSGVGGKSVPGGTWSISLAGNIQKATYTVRVLMGYVEWQQRYCPPSEQNLIS